MSYLPATDLPLDVRVEYPFAGNLLTLPGGANLHYLDEGRGPVVILLHGNPTWSFYFRRLINLLVGRGFRCVVPDHIGCGLSDKPADYPYTLKQRIADVAFLVDHLQIDTYHLIVHDWGGAIGCGLAGQQPERVQRLVLLNTAGFLSKRIPLRIACLKIPILGPALIRGLNAFAGPAAVMSVRKPLAKAVRRGFLWPYRSWKNRVAIWHFVKDIPLREAHPSYRTLAEVESGLGKLREKPVLLFWGGRDFCFNDHFLRRWKELLPKAETCYLKECGHYVLEDAEWAELEKIAAFLEE